MNVEKYSGQSSGCFETHHFHQQLLRGLNQARIMHVQNKKYGNLVSIASLTGKCPARKCKHFAVLVKGHVYIIWTLRSQNKITEFFMILARLSPFKVGLHNILHGGHLEFY